MEALVALVVGEEEAHEDVGTECLEEEIDGNGGEEVVVNEVE